MLKEYLESIKDLTPEKNELTHRLFLHNLLNRLKNHTIDFIINTLQKHY